MNIKINRYKNPAITARTGFEGSIEPEGEAPSWILYWRPDGSAQLWTTRAPSGHVIGTPIELGARTGSVFGVDTCTPRVPLDMLSTGTPSAPVSDDALWVPPAEVIP